MYTACPEGAQPERHAYNRKNKTDYPPYTSAHAVFCWQDSYGCPNLDVEQLSCRQGGFFVTTVSDVPTTPSLWFNGTAYTMFPQENGSYRALVPVEALLKPGSYAIMARHGDWQEKIPVKVIEDPLPVQKVWLDKKTSGLRATRRKRCW